MNTLLGKVRHLGADEIVVGESDETMNKFAAAFLNSGNVNAKVTPLSAFIEQETRKLDIYNPEAARERRVEIVEIKSN